MSGLPSTYQQVLKNMRQIEEDHALITDETNGIVAIAEKVNDPETGIDAINTNVSDVKTDLSDTKEVLTAVKDAVEDPDTGLTATAQKADNAADKVDDISNDIEIINKFVNLPEGIGIDPETGELIIIDPATGEPVIDPETGKPQKADVPEISYDELAASVEKLKQMFIDSTSGGDSSVVTNENGETKVTGVHTSTENYNQNNAPNTYKQGVTYEIKKVVSIGLNGQQGMEGTYCMVATYTKDSALNTDASIDGNLFVPFQIAYNNRDGAYYKRFGTTYDATNGWTAWGNWTAGTRSMEQMGITAAASSSDPDKPNYSGTQLTGEFWYETLS